MIRCPPCSGCGDVGGGKLSTAAGNVNKSNVGSIRLVNKSGGLVKVGTISVGRMGDWQVLDKS